jgi:receptor protein-tyrosine kinase
MSTIEKALAKKKSANTDSSSKGNESIPSATSTINKSPDAESLGNTSSNNQTLIIDKESLIERGYLIDTGERKSIKEEFREIKRKLLRNAFGQASKTLDKSNLIMVSSANPNEGKTFVSINLALSIALEQDIKVLLVDADVLKPSVHSELGVENPQGLIDYLLSSDLGVSDIMYDSNINNLKLLPAGRTHHLANEFLASEKMLKLTEELATRYPDRLVIFDCPPLIGVSETQVLASLVGQALVVVEESNTLISDVTEATKNLSEDLALGIVLNKAIRSHKDLYGYYGYGNIEQK